MSSTPGCTWIRTSQAELKPPKFSPERAALFESIIAACKVDDAHSTAMAGDLDPLVADEIAFHLIDWETDAAFSAAFMMFPEKFITKNFSSC